MCSSYRASYCCNAAMGVCRNQGKVLSTTNIKNKLYLAELNHAISKWIVLEFSLVWWYCLNLEIARG